MLGHRTAQGWIIDSQGVITGSLRSDTYYDLRVVVNGLVVTVLVNGQSVLTRQLDPRWIDGQPYGLNMGLVGVGSNNSRGQYDNVSVQVLPPQTSFDNTDDFTDGVADLFTGASSGTWALAAGRFTGTPSGTAAATNIMTLPARSLGDSTVTVETMIKVTSGAMIKVTSGGKGGIVFDYYADKDFKYVALDLQAGAVVVGHLIRNQWVEDARFVTPLTAGVDYKLSLTLNGTAVTVTLNGAVLGSFSYNGAVADGGVGAISRTGTTSFDDLHVAIGVHVSNSPDGQPPVVNVPVGLTRPADLGKATAFISDSTLGTATATDNVGVVSLVRSGVPAGNIFPIGVTTLTWTATDVFGNQTVGTQLVTVVDTQKPVLVVPPNLSRQIPGNSSSIIVTDAELGTATASDNSGSVTIVRTGVPAGNVFPVGTTTITYTATDAAGNVTTGTQTVTVTRPAPVIAVSVTDANGAEAGADPIVFTISRSVSLVDPVVVNLGWSGTAVYGTDYTVTVTGGTLSANGLTLTLAAGVATATVTVTPIDDTSLESAESVVLTLKTGTGYALGSPTSATGSIADNDVPSLSVSDYTVTEGNTGTTTISIVITLSGPLTTNVTFTIATVQGSATAGKDYQAKTSTLTIAAGATSAVFQVTIVNDKVAEPRETFGVTIASVSGAPVAKGTGTVTIVDNDGGGLTAYAAAPAGGTVAAKAESEWLSVRALVAFSGVSFRGVRLPELLRRLGHAPAHFRAGYGRRAVLHRLRRG